MSTTDFGSLDASDLFIDCTGALKAGEEISSVTSESSNAAVLSVTSQINTAESSHGSIIADIGKAVEYTVTGLSATARGHATLTFHVVGSTGTKREYKKTFNLTDGTVI